MFKIMIVIIIYHRHKPIHLIPHLLSHESSWRSRGRTSFQFHCHGHLLFTSTFSFWVGLLQSIEIRNQQVSELCEVTVEILFKFVEMQSSANTHTILSLLTTDELRSARAELVPFCNLHRHGIKVHRVQVIQNHIIKRTMDRFLWHYVSTECLIRVIEFCERYTYVLS
jgi:hypothetical protein